MYWAADREGDQGESGDGGDCGGVAGVGGWAERKGQVGRGRADCGFVRGAGGGSGAVSRVAAAA